MWLRIACLLLAFAALAGCSGNAPTTSAGTTARPLPPEVTGDPADALPKQKKPG